MKAEPRIKMRFRFHFQDLLVVLLQYSGRYVLQLHAHALNALRNELSTWKPGRKAVLSMLINDFYYIQ